MDRVKIQKPGTFSVYVSADTRRAEFDCKNEVIVTNRVPVDFVFIGDSITEMWELNAYFRKNKLILNRGIGGDRTEYLLKRFEADVIQPKPEYAVLMIGVNDASELEDDPWTGKKGGSPESITETIIKNITSMLELASGHGQKMILCSILPTNMTFSPKNMERNKVILQVNHSLRQIAKARELIYVDYHSHLVKEDGLTMKDGLTLEGLHPHVYGYDIMAEVLRKELRDNHIEI